MTPPRPRPVEILSALALGVFACLIMSGVAGDRTSVLLSNLGQVAVPLAAGVACVRASRRAEGRPDRRAWAFLATSCWCWATGQAVWTFYETSGVAAPFPSLADAGYLAAVPFALAAVWSLSPRSGASARLVTLVDGLIIAGALLSMSWPLILGPSWHAGGDSPVVFALTLAYPIGNIAVASAILTALIRCGRRGWTTLAMIGAGLLVLAAADSIFVLDTLAGTERLVSFADVGWMAGYLLIMLAALRHPLPAAIDPADDSASLRRALLPFAVVTAAVTVRIGLVVDNRPSDTFLTAVTIVVAGLVLARHLMTMRENQVLTRSLEEKIGELTSREEELVHQAFHDPLTGLANRQLFGDRVDHALERSRRTGSMSAVLFVDLDDFKTVNDSLGHSAGDELLQAVGTRLVGCVRPGDTVARLGGDEFGVLLEEVGSRDEPAVVSGRIMEVLEVPFDLEGREVFARASIGAALSDPFGNEDGATLLADADVALYAAKSAGKSAFRRFERSMRDAAIDRLELGQDLRRAVERDQFECHYQPIVDLVTGKVVAAEALVRWRHPVRGLLAPNEFVAMAEETGLIAELGLLVLESACKQAVSWRRHALVPSTMALHVNLSSRQLHDADLVDQVHRVLATTGLDPAALVLEITEGVAVDIGARHLERLLGLRDLGVRLAIDDFGSGYSSLNYLRSLPVDVLKIDRAFAQTADGVTDPVLLEAIVTLGQSLGIETVAEGIEREEQAATLRRLGCRLAQGYLFSPPLAAGELPAALRRMAAAGPRPQVDDVSATVPAE